MSAIITTGINIVATGVANSINQIKRFGQALTQTERNVNNFANNYNRQQRRMFDSSMGLSTALRRNWQSEFNAILQRNGRDQGKALKALEQNYDRTFRNIGNKYQSMVMGSVALSMSGIGIKNAGMSILGSAKSSLDVAKDFELVMKQIQFYGHRTAGEMGTIQKNIIKLGYDLPVTTSEVANSVLEAQKLGYDKVTDAMKMAKEASKIQFMGLGKINGEESLKYISQFRQLTGTTIGDVDTLTDKLSKTADVSAASIDSLWKTIQSSRTAYDALGSDVDTFLTLTGTLADRLTPRNAGMALNSFAGGVQMAEKARREYQANPNSKMTRGKNYSALIDAMGGKDFDAYKGDVLQFIEDVAVKSKKIWGSGSERKGNLQSIFGKSALDLFYAIDSAMKKTGKSMHGIRDEIGKSGGHAEKYMDAIMNTSYGTEMKLQAVKEQFQILFGTAIRPVFNKILTGIEKVVGAINKFVANHPKLAKVLGYGFGLTGLLLTATGASMMFVGGILAIYASLANLFVQLARNTRVLNLLSSGYSTAGAMIRAQMLGPLGLLGKSLLKMSGITFFLYLAWKNDFLRMKTKFLEWKDAIGRGLKASEVMFKAYSKNSVNSLNEAFARNRATGSFDGWVANTWTKARMLWDGIKDIWKDGTVSVEKYQMLKDAGLLPYIESVYKWKTRISEFWDGFQDGMKEGIRLLKDLLHPLKPIWDWVSGKVLALFQHFGYFKETGKGIGSIWQQAGEKLGYIVGSAIAIRIALWGWLKAAKLVISPFKLIYGITKKIAGTLDKFKDFGKMMKGLGKFVFKAVIPKPLRNWMAYGANRGQQRAMRGASSPLPNARPVIDPTTRQQRRRNAHEGQLNPRGHSQAGMPRTPYMTDEVTYQRPRNWRERRRLNRERRRANGSIRQGIELPNGSTSSQTRRSRNPIGRIRDFFRGEAYIPEQRVDRRGRTYHQVRTRQGGVMRTNAQGLVRGQSIRTPDFRTRTRNRIQSVGNRIRTNRLLNNRLTNNRATRRIVNNPVTRGAVRGTRAIRQGIRVGADVTTRPFRQVANTTRNVGSRAVRRVRNIPTRARGMATLTNMINFSDAGMDYGSSVGRRGHRRRSVVAGIKGFFNRSRRSGISAGGNSLASQLQARQGEVEALGRRGRAPRAPRMARTGGGRVGRIFGGLKNIGSMLFGGRGGGGSLFTNLFKGAGKGIAKVGPVLGKGLIKGLGFVVKRGLPLLFKVGLHAIPILGWALTAWDAISLIWSNWDAITKAGKWVWDKIKQFGTWAWNGIKAGAGKVWDWIKSKAKGMWDGVKSFGKSVWNSIKSVASGVWNWVKAKATGVWNGIKAVASAIWNGIKAFATAMWNHTKAKASAVWNAIKGTAIAIWNGIKAFASAVWSSIKAFGRAIWAPIKALGTSMWSGIKSFASGVWSSIKGYGRAIWSSIKSVATSMWSGIKSFANGVWNGIKSHASSIWGSVKSAANSVFNGLLGAFKTAWGKVKSWATNNPITQTIKQVTKKITGGGKSDGNHRTGLWKVPKDGYQATLHNGEMVLTQKEAQIMRSLVGSDNNSISQYLLEKSSNHSDNEMKVASNTKRPSIKPNITIKTAEQREPKIQQTSGNVEIKMEQGAVQINVANASASEMKKATKQIYAELKRLMELENMKNYKPARPRTR